MCSRPCYSPNTGACLFQQQQVANGWCRDFYEGPQRWIYLMFSLVSEFDDDTNSPCERWFLVRLSELDIKVVININ